MINLPGATHRGPLPPADEPLRRLAEDLRRFVGRMAGEIGERNLLRRPRQLALAAECLAGAWSDAGYEVARQEYRAAGCPCQNLEAELPGKIRPDEIVVVGAHYDSVVGSPGANDNASGVAALVALAHHFAGRTIGRTLRFVGFVNEEPPYFQTEEMGSWVPRRRCRRRGENVVAMLSLETIGYYDDAPGSQNYPLSFAAFYPTVGNFIGFVANQSSAELLERVVGEFRKREPFPSEGGALPEWIPGVGFSDHWSFWREGYPAIMVTDTAMYRYPHYHQPTDTEDKIRFEPMARVVRGLREVLAALVHAE